MTDNTLTYYWKWLANAPKAHVFDSTYGRSLCGRWLHLGQPGDDSQSMGDQPGRDDCKTCWKKLRAALEVEPINPVTEPLAEDWSSAEDEVWDD